jgi:hypothetical protein
LQIPVAALIAAFAAQPLLEDVSLAGQRSLTVE